MMAKENNGKATIKWDPPGHWIHLAAFSLIW